MSCECASLRMEVLSQKSEILSQRTLMVQWFEMLMTELQDVKKQNSELRELFKASTSIPHQQESSAVHSEPSILEGFPVNGSLETNGNSVQNVLECQPERPHETLNPFITLLEVVAPELEQENPLIETGFQLTEDDQKIFSPEIESAEVNSEYPLPQRERFDSTAINALETSRPFANEDTGPQTKQLKTVHRAESSSPKRQGSDASKGKKPTARKIGKSRCKKCPYQTWNRSTLKAHSGTHAAAKPFKCSVCTKSFTYKSMLLSHNLTHTGEKPFKCTICKRSFSKKEPLMRHNLIHTGEKPFECDQCDYRSSRKAHLIIHRRIHTGEKPFQCDMCDYRAADKCNLIRHKKLLNHQQ